MLNGLLTIVSILAVVMTGLWFVYSRSEQAYDKLVLAFAGIGFVISLCIASYIAGAKVTFKALQESEDYQLPEWFQTASDSAGSIVVIGIVCMIGISSFFRSLKKTTKE